MQLRSPYIICDMFYFCVEVGRFAQRVDLVTGLVTRYRRSTLKCMTSSIPEVFIFMGREKTRISSKELRIPNMQLRSPYLISDGFYFCVEVGQFAQRVWSTGLVTSIGAAQL